MTTVTTTGTVAFATPKKYHKIGECPHCGAPICADASITKGKDGEVFTVLPQPHYTCACRFSLQPHVVPMPIAPIQPWTPAPTYPGGDPLPWPGTTWIVNKPSVNQCNNELPKGPQCDFDWKRFCGSGGVTATPFKGVVLY